eukprot:CAMPEP_0201732624 /NCGR_PEP_ID=MMETSP0593-20130828/29323_1 /ASSEMBLY_ACC=CAM_ASM_000672 /TAXON_ID=267983 /ORGANISM="Skeletonema japonicum, Strain CCMP2506" /LENGTH=263 /DNA_ID=CAMNT_0048225611 /DNA_START=46 /DNA_END=837 /DNA_ORIENTATION=-
MTPPTAASKKGIAIQEALSILSDRAKTGEHISNSKSVPDELKGRGQTIDISEELEFKNPANFSACECATGAADNDDSENSGDSVQDARHEAMKQARIERGEEIKSKVRSMSISDLLGMIFGAQQERVSTYKIYEDGLSTILLSRDITDYPALCAKVTASFSVLSDTINAAKSSLLEQHKRKDISTVVEQLQKHECDKLNFTAALHLERLRLNNSELGVGNDADERAAKLLKESIQTLKGKISLTVQSINESIDELRCIAVDEE